VSRKRQFSAVVLALLLCSSWRAGAEVALRLELDKSRYTYGDTIEVTLHASATSAEHVGKVYWTITRSYYRSVDLYPNTFYLPFESHSGYESHCWITDFDLPAGFEQSGPLIDGKITQVLPMVSGLGQHEIRIEAQLEGGTAVSATTSFCFYGGYPLLFMPGAPPIDKMHCDRQGRVWFGTGGEVWGPYPRIIPPDYSDWRVIYGDLYVIENGEMRLFYDIDPGDCVWSIDSDEQGRVWVVIGHGGDYPDTAIWSIEGDTTVAHPELKQLFGRWENPEEVRFDPSGLMWVVCMSAEPDMVKIIDLDNPSCRGFAFDETRFPDCSSVYRRPMVFGPDGMAYFHFYRHKVVYCDGYSFGDYSHLNSPVYQEVHCFLVDADNRKWFEHDPGLCMLDDDGWHVYAGEGAPSGSFDDMDYDEVNHNMYVVWEEYDWTAGWRYRLSVLMTDTGEWWTTSWDEDDDSALSSCTIDGNNVKWFTSVSDPLRLYTYDDHRIESWDLRDYLNIYEDGDGPFRDFEPAHYYYRKLIVAADGRRLYCPERELIVW